MTPTTTHEHAAPRRRSGRWLASTALATLCILGTSLAQAAGHIEAISSYVQGGAEVLRIDLSEAPSEAPPGFAIQTPPRIALDFIDTSNATGQNSIDINQGNLKTANVVQAGERTRVVLNLKQSTPYKTEVQGKSVFVTLEPVSSASVATSTSTHFAEAQSADTQALKDLDFRRGSDGAGRIVVDLGNNQVGIDIQQQGKGLVVEFLRSNLPEGLRRRLDVTDFGTPVQLISTSQKGERVRMEIDAIGEWEHSAYQTDSQFVVEVRPKKVDLNKLAQGPNYTGDKLSLNFQDISLRALLGVFAEFTGINIVTSDTVAGAVTLRLQDVPWDQALQIVMEGKGLGYTKTGNVMWIAPKDEIDERKKKDHEAALAIEKLEPLRTQAYQLNYAKANDILRQITGDNASGGGGGANSARNRLLTERGSAIAEPRTNQLFVNDVPTKLEEVRQLLLALDIPIRQVMIEARIVEARDTFGRSLGVRLGGGDLRAQRGGDGGYGIGGGNRLALGTDYSNATNSAGFGGNVDVGSNFVNMPASLSNSTDAGRFALSIFNSAANRFLSLELSALEADGQGKIVSSPRLITADQVKASIKQGTELPYVTRDQNGTNTIFRDAVLKLEVTPQITPEGNIILDLDVSKDSPGVSTPNGFAIDKKSVQTQVLVENGGTVVIGGIFEMTESSEQNKVPLLGDIPVMGNLFKNRTKESEKRELLVFITPKVITDHGAMR